MTFSKTTKQFPKEVALEKNGQVIRVLRSTGDPGFSQFNENFNGMKGFLIIRASSDNKEAILNIIKS